MHKSQSKRLRNRRPHQSGLWRRRSFLLPRSPGLQKVSENKQLIDNMFRDKTLSIIKTNFIIKAVKDEKMPNDEKDRQCHGCCRRLCILSRVSRGQNCNTASFKKALAMSQQFSFRKVPYRQPRADFCGGRKKQTSSALNSGTYNGGEGTKAICQPSYLPSTSTADIFLFQRGKVKAGRPLTASGRPHDKLGDGPLQTVHPNRCWGGLQKSWNSWVYKIIRIEVISPCVFDSEHTSEISAVPKVCVELKKWFPDVSCFLETFGTVYGSRIIFVMLFSLVRDVGQPFI